MAGVKGHSVNGRVAPEVAARAIAALPVDHRDLIKPFALSQLRINWVAWLTSYDPRSNHGFLGDTKADMFGESSNSETCIEVGLNFAGSIIQHWDIPRSVSVDGVIIQDWIIPWGCLQNSTEEIIQHWQWDIPRSFVQCRWKNHPRLENTLRMFGEPYWGNHPTLRHPQEFGWASMEKLSKTGKYLADVCRNLPKKSSNTVIREWERDRITLPWESSNIDLSDGRLNLSWGIVENSLIAFPFRCGKTEVSMFETLTRNDMETCSGVQPEFSREESSNINYFPRGGDRKEDSIGNLLLESSLSSLNY